MEFSELEKHIGKKLTIKGMRFSFGIVKDLGGDWAVWSGKKYSIYATLNYEMRGVPVEIQDWYGEHLTEDSYTGEVRDFEHYCEIVKAYSEVLFLKIDANSKKQLCIM